MAECCANVSYYCISIITLCTSKAFGYAGSDNAPIADTRICQAKSQWKKKCLHWWFNNYDDAGDDAITTVVHDI